LGFLPLTDRAAGIFKGEFHEAIVLPSSHNQASGFVEGN
jgi:hypothetical protein